MENQRLWIAAVATFGVGDVVTTHIGLEQSGVRELHPLSEKILDLGGNHGMVATKAVILLAFLLMSRVVPDEYSDGIPLGLFLLGLFIVANNINVIRQADRATE